ncbi:hypothetical protein X975_24731, partial [Stegodyphus mimosarum]
MYLRLREPCQKNKKTVKKEIVIKPIVHSKMNSRGKFNLIDMQSNPDYHMKFILV